MDGRIAYLRRRRLLWALVFSGLLHLLFFLFAPRWSKLTLFQAPEQSLIKMDPRIAFEIVESPEENRITESPEDVFLASDKNAMASDLSNADKEDTGLPYSAGYFEDHILPKPGSPQTQGGQNQEEPNKEEKQEDDQQANEDQAVERSERRIVSNFSREILMGREIKTIQSKERAGYDQKEFSVSDEKGISFNTYEWDFAPYLLELQERIENNIYPPTAFTYLGFNGTNVIRFQIYPDGKLENEKVLGAEGEKALIETSMKAIQVSAPFMPLPKDFPEEYLEVTAKFNYYIDRKE